MRPATRELGSAAIDGASETVATSRDSSLALLLEQLIISKAAEMARAGQHSEAARMLAEFVRERGQAPAAIDLLARIRAQQGNLSEAEALWNEAARLDPANPGYDAALNRIRRINRRPTWITSLLPASIGLVIIVFVIAALLAARNYLSDFRSAVRSDVQSEIASLEARQQPVADATARESQAALKEPQPATEQAPQLRINLAGVNVKAEADENVITFAEGLFDRGAELKPEAERILGELGRQLEPHAGLNVIVAGHSDDLPVRRSKRFSNNEALCFARAVAVIERLRQSARLPVSMFAARASENNRSPYPNDTPENRARNRTVVMRISALKK